MSYSKSPNNTKERKKERYPNKAGKQDSEAQISDLHENKKKNYKCILNLNMLSIRNI
jgi:hypothetical protein